MKPLIASPLTLAALFRAAEPILGDVADWHLVGFDNADRQEAAVQAYATYRAIVSEMREIESTCAWSADEINAWLAARKFDIMLEPFSPKTFGMAAVSDFSVQWPEAAGLEHIRRPDGSTHEGFRLKSDWLLCDDDPGENTTLWVRTQSNDVIGIAMAPRPGSESELLKEVRMRMSVPARSRHPSPAMADLPMVDLDAKLDLSYLVGMWTKMPDRKFPDIITQALGQAMFRMNEKGARARVAMAAAVTRSLSMPRVIAFNKPFLLWIERPGVNVPLFAAYLESDCWKKPAEL